MSLMQNLNENYEKKNVFNKLNIMIKYKFIIIYI